MQLIAAGPVYYCYGVYAGAFSAEYGASRTAISMGYSLLTLVGALGSIPVGWLIERYPLRPLLCLGALGTGCGLMLVGQTNAMWQVILLFATLIAASDVLLGNVTSNFLISHWFQKRRGLAIGISVIGASAAAIIFPPLASNLIASTGWRTTFLIFGTMTVSLILPIWFLCRIPAAMPAREIPSALTTPDGPTHSPILGQAVLPAVYLTSKQLILTRAFWIISICCGAMMGVNGAMMVSIVPFAMDRGIDRLDAAALVSFTGIGALAGKILFGIVADKMDLRHAQRLGLLVMMVSMALLMMDLGVTQLLATALFFGLSLGGMMPVWGALAAHIFGLTNYGRGLGITRAAMVPFAMGCPLAAGYIFDVTGSYDGAWLGFLLMLSGAMALTFWGKKWAQPLSA